MANYYKTLNEAFDIKFDKLLNDDQEYFDEALSDEDRANNEMIKRLYDKPESKWTKSEKEFANKHNLYRNKSYPNQEIRNRKTGKSLTDRDVHKAVSGDLHKSASSIFNNEMNQLDYLNTPYNSYAPRGNNAYGYFDDKLSKNSSVGDYAPYVKSQNNKKITVANRKDIAQRKSRIDALTKEAEQAAERYGETGDERDKYNMERYLRQIEDEKRYIKRQEKQNDLDYVFNAGQLPESLTEDTIEQVVNKHNQAIGKFTSKFYDNDGKIKPGTIMYLTKLCAKVVENSSETNEGKKQYYQDIIDSVDQYLTSESKRLDGMSKADRGGYVLSDEEAAKEYKK